MKIIAKFTNGFFLKLGLITMLTLSFFPNNIIAQNDIDDSKAHLNLVYHTKKPGETDWQFLDRTKLYLPKNINAATENKGILDLYRVYDEIHKNKMQLAEVFLDNFPQDKHYDDVMRMLYYENFHPYFISKKISDSLVKSLNSKGRYGSSREEWTSAFRAIPIDEQARSKYLKKTSDLVRAILASNASIERKYKAEFMLFCRDYITAYRIQNLLPKNSKMNKLEAGYWQRFDLQFWDSFRLRIETLLNTYGIQKSIATDLRQILNGIENFSPEAAYTYWKYFADTLGTINKSNEDQVGLKTFHKFAIDYVAAVENLKVSDATEPLDMLFTAMDGTKVDLSKMRGKVVLIDFWTTWCSPCIKEMPHVQALYNKYRDKGFEVIGIAGNGVGNEDRIREIQKKTGANWPQRIDGGVDATVSFISLYKINSFPTVWLLDKEGKVVDKNARGQRLEPLIRKHLGLDKEKNELFAKIKNAEKDLNWKDYTKFSIDYVNAYLQKDYSGLNYFAWSFYENEAITDTKALNEAIKWVKIAIENDKEHELAYMDTYASLLYKLGNKKEALKLAKKILKETKKSGADTKGALALIKKIKDN